MIQGAMVRRLRVEPSSWAERYMLVAFIVMLPLERVLPQRDGYSTVFALVACIGIYAVIWRPQSLLLTALSPAALPMYAWLVTATVMEIGHPDANHEAMARVGCMFAAALLVGTLCRDKRALRSALLAMAFTGLYVAIIFIISKYSTVRGTAAATIDEANRLRGVAFNDSPIPGDLNGFAAIMAEGAAVALGMGFVSRNPRQRLIFWGIAAVCGVGSFVPLSRGGMAMIIVAFSGIFWARRKVGSGGMAFAVLLAVLIALMPSASWTRFGIASFTGGSHAEGRVRILMACLNAADEYLPFGVGWGNYFTSWGLRPGLSHMGRVSGPHNAFIAVTLYWGFLGLIALLAVVRAAWWCVPKRCALDREALGLLGLSLCLLVLLGVTHCLHDKNFTVGFGLLLAARRWIWPAGEVVVSPPILEATA